MRSSHRCFLILAYSMLTFRWGGSASFINEINNDYRKECVPTIHSRWQGLLICHPAESCLHSNLQKGSDFMCRAGGPDAVGNRAGVC